MIGAGPGVVGGFSLQQPPLMQPALENWMAPVPRRFALERRGRTDKRCFVTSGELHANRHVILAEATRERHTGMTGEIEWGRVALQFQNEIRLDAERTDVRERERCERLDRHEQRVDTPEDVGEAPAQFHPP